MKRVTTIEFTPEEVTLLTLCEAAAAAEWAAYKARHRAVKEAVAAGITMRIVGRHAGYCAAQVSRISNGLVEQLEDSAKGGKK